MLVCFDPVLIPLFLDYHNKSYRGKEVFSGYLQYIIYDMVSRSSPIENTARLEKIVKWIERSRESEKKGAVSNRGVGVKSDLKRRVTPFVDFLFHKNKMALAEKIKAEFCTHKSKGIRFMIEALKEKGLLRYGDREGKSVYRSMKEFFNHDIGVYESIFAFKVSEAMHKSDFDLAIKKVEGILSDL
jgi:hypothetical protein